VVGQRAGPGLDADRRPPPSPPRRRCPRGQPTGVLGDPAGATAEEGAAILADLAQRLVTAAAAWDVDAAGRLREPRTRSGTDPAAG
jgi:hypothetical protein